MRLGKNIPYILYLEKTGIRFINSEDFNRINQQYLFSADNPLLIDLGINTSIDIIEHTLMYLQAHNIPFLITNGDDISRVHKFLHYAASLQQAEPIYLNQNYILFTKRYEKECLMLVRWWNINECNPLILYADIKRKRYTDSSLFTKEKVSYVTEFLDEKNVSYKVYLRKDYVVHNKRDE